MAVSRRHSPGLSPEQGFRLSTASSAPAVPHQSFAALRHPGFRMYLLGNALAMAADSVEHVITYWVAFQKFQSPALGGFAVLSHWVPFLLFSGVAGALADRVDPRRLVQIGMVLFIFCSLIWSILIMTDSLQMWHAGVLLLIHGCAGVFWGPPSQVLIHDIVGADRLPGAVRLMATARYLGLLAGPAVGAVFMIVFGPVVGLMLNAAIYLPLTLWLVRAPYGPKYRDASAARPHASRGFAALIATARQIASNPTVVSMILLSGCASLIISN